jgi:acyl-CoA synthetase (AMP-forming)/AMP-acid ligase II
VNATSLLHPSARLIDDATGAILAGSELRAEVDRRVAEFAALPPGVIFARTAISLSSVLRYISAYESGRAVALLDPGLPAEALEELVRRYQPAAVVGLDEGEPADLSPAKGYLTEESPALGLNWRHESGPEAAPHPDLAVLLATSGSTGNPKLVRLSRTAVHANATGIAQALGLDENEIAPTSLPLFYTYGLSVLNSHLVGGATVLVVDGGVLSRDFWRGFDRHGATSLSGVPHHYEMLTKIRWKAASHPSLRTLTQAGGKMRVELVAAMHEQISATGGRLFVMYGQTEATARIAILPHDRLPEKLGSAGLPVPGGSISIRLDDGTMTTEAGMVGEVVFTGPNVMQGYADDVNDLARGDDLGGVLATGDIGHLDPDGFLFLDGRVKRIGKVFGIRVNLDDVERLAALHVGPVAAVSGADKVVVFVTAHAEGVDLAGHLASELRLHRSGFDVRTVDVLPTLSSGKLDYRRLTEEVQQ